MTQANLDIAVPTEKLEEVFNRIARYAQDDLGFLIAFREAKDPYTVGFSFIAISDEYLAVVHATLKASGDGSKMEFNLEDIRFIKNYDQESVQNFLGDSIKKGCELAKISPEDFVQTLGKYSFFWRFVGCIDGKITDDKENGPAWRYFWAFISEACNAKQIHPRYPETLSKLILEKLSSHSQNAPVILDR